MNAEQTLKTTEYTVSVFFLLIKSDKILYVFLTLNEKAKFIVNQGG